MNLDTTINIEGTKSLMFLYLQHQAVISINNIKAIDNTKAINDTEEDLENVQAQRLHNRGNHQV